MYEKLKSDLRSSMLRETANNRLCIALNSPGTAFFDPKPAVADFLTKKDRRLHEPDSDIYKKREFVAKFFSLDNFM